VIVPGSSEIRPVPAYGLAGAFHGTQRVEGEGRDLCTVVHHPSQSETDIVVGVDRRAGKGPGPDSSDGTDVDDLARVGMATALVVDLPGLGDSVFSVAAEVADDPEVWRPCEMFVDGRRMAGVETQYEGRWLAYCLTPELIIYVLAPLDGRPDSIEVRRL
jgi:hypothetical protein